MAQRSRAGHPGRLAIPRTMKKSLKIKHLSADPCGSGSAGFLPMPHDAAPYGCDGAWPRIGRGRERCGKMSDLSTPLGPNRQTGRTTWPAVVEQAPQGPSERITVSSR